MKVVYLQSAGTLTKINAQVTVKAKTLSSWIFENVRKEIAIAEKDQKPEANEERKKEKERKRKKKIEIAKRKKG